MIIFTSSSRAGSWEVRGRQLAAAIGGAAIIHPQPGDLAGAHVVIGVKRPPPDDWAVVRRSRAARVLDIVDAWPQPAANAWDMRAAHVWLQRFIEQHDPDGVVVSGQSMLEAVPRGLAALVLPHHARPWQIPNPIRERVQVVGYEGSERYLDDWRETIEAECARRGWRFVVNPRKLADLDVVLAVRGGIWRGPISDHWKSNVKLANAQATGTPIIMMPESCSLEHASGAEVVITQPDELHGAFDLLTPHRDRLARSSLMRSVAVGTSLETLANSYRAWLDAL